MPNSLAHCLRCKLCSTHNVCQNGNITEETRILKLKWDTQDITQHLFLGESKREKKTFKTVSCKPMLIFLSNLSLHQLIFGNLRSVEKCCEHNTDTSSPLKTHFVTQPADMDEHLAYICLKFKSNINLPFILLLFLVSTSTLFLEVLVENRCLARTEPKQQS